MYLSFENREIRDICEDEAIAAQMLGLEVSIKLQNRLSDMIAASYVTDLPPVGNPRETKGNPHPYYIIDLDNYFQIVFCSNHVTIPASENGMINWSRVNRIKILAIQKK